MNTFCEHHQNSIKFGYRCFDLILLNGLIQPFQQPERVIGFFNAYRDGERVTRNRLRDIAQQFENWVKNRCQRWGAPVLDAPMGRRDDFVDPYFKHAKKDEVVVILKAREPARIMIAIGAEGFAGTSSWPIAGLSNITFTLTTIIGVECSFASVPTYPFQGTLPYQHHLAANLLHGRRNRILSNIPVISQIAAIQRSSRNWQILDRTRSAELWTKMASLPDSILQRQRTQRSRLPAPAFLLPSGILR